MIHVHYRQLSGMLALLCAASALTACAEDAAKPDPSAVSSGVQTTAPAQETEAATEEDVYGRANVKDSLSDTMDLGGITIRILTRTGDRDTRVEFLADAETGDVVEDAVYQRNRKVMERLNVNMEIFDAGPKANRGDGTEVNKLLDKSVLAGEDAYDLVANHMSQITPYILKGAFLNMHDLPYLDWEQPWWNQSYIEKITLNGKQYMCAGELAQTIISGTYVMFFNQKLFHENFPGENLYQVVRDGNWTLDKMTAYCSVMYHDLNGNGKPDEGDQFGNIHETSHIQSDAFSGGADLKFTAYDENAGTYYWCLENEQTAEFLEKTKKLLHENNNTLFVDFGRLFTTLMDPLKNDTVLFTSHMLSATDRLRDMKNDYGIIPMPKLNEIQEQYTTFSHNGFSVFAIPITCRIAESVAPFLEAMCAESYRLVTPAYYDVALKVKYIRDKDAAEMLDLCTKSLVFDFGYLFNQYIDSSTAIFRTMFDKAARMEKGLSSIHRKEKKVNQLLGEIMEMYESLDS